MKSRINKINFNTNTIELNCLNINIDNLISIKSNINKRGTRKSTTYIRIPKQFRNKLKNKQKVSIMRLGNIMIINLKNKNKKMKNDRTKTS